MQNTRSVPWAVAIVVLILYACAGTDNRLPSPQTLIDRHVERAYGGRGLGAKDSMTVEGRLVIESHDIDAPVTIKTKAPDMRHFQVTVGGEEVVRSCFAGRCWVKELGSPLQALRGDYLAFMVERADFYRLENLDRHYRNLETTGMVQFNDQPAYELTLTRDNGVRDRWYFSAESGLWLGGSWRLPQSLGGMRVTQLFRDYQSFDGIRMPTEVLETSPDQISKVVIEEVSFGEIPDTEFKVDG